jgi:hypothetical protein
MRIKEFLESIKDIDVDKDIEVEVFKSGNTWSLMEIESVGFSPDEDEVRINVSYWGRGR